MTKTNRMEGFGLAEVMLASGVLILVVASVVALSRFVIRGYAVTASRTQALYLAQEGMEQVRNVRDTLWIDGDPDTEFSDLSDGTYHATWNAATDRWELAANGEQVTNIGGITFNRSIAITPVSIDARLNAHMKLVTVTVSWTESGRDWLVSTESFLTNWKLEA